MLQLSSSLDSASVLREDFILLLFFLEADFAPLKRELCLWNKPFSNHLNNIFLSRPLFLGDSDRPRLGSGLPDMLWAFLDPSLFLMSLLLLGVLDSECCETSSKAASDAGPFRFSCNTYFPFLVVFRITDVGVVGVGPECVLMGSILGT
ncbi:hypothetical protein Tco_0945527 [Tanacetum coccineum]